MAFRHWSIVYCFCFRLKVLSKRIRNTTTAHATKTANKEDYILLGPCKLVSVLTWCVRTYTQTHTSMQSFVIVLMHHFHLSSAMCWVAMWHLTLCTLSQWGRRPSLPGDFQPCGTACASESLRETPQPSYMASQVCFIWDLQPYSCLGCDT